MTVFSLYFIIIHWDNHNSFIINETKMITNFSNIVMIAEM